MIWFNFYFEKARMAGHTSYTTDMEQNASPTCDNQLAFIKNALGLLFFVA